jgi:hypothetical protein
MSLDPLVVDIEQVGTSERVTPTDRSSRNSSRLPSRAAS